VLMGDLEASGVNTVFQAAEVLPTWTFRHTQVAIAMENAIMISNELASMADLAESLGHRELSAVVLLVAAYVYSELFTSILHSKLVSMHLAHLRGT
jgi:hypothetical protein